jgi:3',5'-cyclic-AMP phosphodiesterase
MSRRIISGQNRDRIDRRGFLECMAWIGTGIVYTIGGGVLKSEPISTPRSLTNREPGEFTFVQISDSHIGFKHDPNNDVTATLQEAVDKINAMPEKPDFVVHTGDITHLSAPAEFDTASQVLTGVKTSRVFYVPGEHDVLNDDGKEYLNRHGKGTAGNGWYSFEHKGVHFIGLVNVLNLKPGGLGLLGEDQLEWLEKDVSGLSGSTPVVVFGHMPLWSIYPDWGWGTDDATQALRYLRRFGSVTVLNGHIHQTIRKVEGNVTFHTALSTAYPQPQPGTAPGPGPLKVPAEKLRSLLGLTGVEYVQAKGSLAVIDSALAEE